MGEAGDTPVQQDNAEAERVLLDHAVRCWNAEVENAARYERERRLLLTAILAIVGFGVYQLLPGGGGAQSWTGACLFWLIAGVSGLLFIAAFISVIVNRTAEPNDGDTLTASFLMRLPDDVVGDVAPPHLDALRLVRNQTYAAYLDLQARNARIKARVRQSGACFVAALVLVVIASIILVTDHAFSVDRTPADNVEDVSDAQQQPYQPAHHTPPGPTAAPQRVRNDPPVDAADGEAVTGHRADDP